MTSQVIDTSALVKYVLPEDDSTIVEKLVAFHHAGMTNLMAPEIYSLNQRMYCGSTSNVATCSPKTQSHHSARYETWGSV